MLDLGVGTDAQMPVTDVFLVYEVWGSEDTIHVAKVYGTEAKAQEYMERVKQEHSTFDCWYEKRAIL